jgi:protein AbiQ
MDDLNFFEIDVSYVDYLKNIEINKRGFSRVPNMVYDKN